MRRLVGLTALLLLSACSSADPADPAAAPTPVGVPAASPAAAASAAPDSSAAAAAPGSSAAPASSGDAALKNDTDAICAQAAKTGAAAGRTFAEDIKLLIEAETAKDAAVIGQAQGKTARDVDNYSFALADMAKLTSDPALKKALTAMGTQVAALKGDVRKLDAEKLAGLQESLAKVCGTA